MKNNILKSLCYINAFLFLIGASSLDSMGIFYNISLLLVTISGIWFILFLIANYEYLVRKYEDM